MTDVRWPRKHGRLESFLQRILAGEAASVSWYETCIVEVGPSKRPSHRFVALAGGLLYVIDDPPKRVRAALALGDVTEIQMVHEKPLFLKGEDRERSQHIKLSYKSSNFKDNIFRSVSRLQTVSSRISSRASNVILTDTDSDRKRRKLRKLLSWPKELKIANGQVEPLRSASVLDFADSGSLGSFDRTSEVDKVSVRRMWPFSALTVGEVIMRSEPHSPVLSLLTRHGWDHHNRPEITSPDLMSSETSSLISGSVRSELTVRSEPLPRSRTVLGNYEDHRLLRTSSATFRSLPETAFVPMTMHEEESHIETQGELHIYILTPNSAFFVHLNSAWQNCLIKETLELDEDQQRLFKNDGHEYLEHSLQDLHRKLLLKSEDNFVRIRLQVDHILKAVENSPFAKKVFWKDPHLFPAVVNKIHSLVLAPDNLEDHTIGFTMDKIKACTSLVRILAALLRDTETCIGRSKHIAYRNGQRTKALITTLVCMPWIPPAYRDITVTVVTSADNYSSRDWETLMEAPLIRSVVELTNVSSMVLYQCFQLSIPSREDEFNQKSASVTWMVKIISEVKGIDTFISRVMCQLLCFASSADEFPLTPYQSVVLHQQLSLLMTFMTYSTSLALQITLMFGEEIRYFIISQVIEKKIPSHYTIRPSLLNLVDSLRQAVLEKRAGVASVTQLLSFSHTL